MFSKQMQMLFKSIGVDAQKRVIFYQNNSGYDAARGVWLLKFPGHKRASLLDGGLNLRKRNHLHVSTEDLDPPKRTSRFIAGLDESRVATLDSLSRRVNGKISFQIFDARTEDECKGTFQRAFKAGGISRVQ